MQAATDLKPYALSKAGMVSILIILFAVFNSIFFFGILYQICVNLVWGYLAILSLPIVFSSILFSLLIQEHPQIDLALGSNLLGCMVGGCLEYTAMIFGYKILTLVLPGIYLIAILVVAQSNRTRHRHAPAG
jgi:hypothetical protein